MGNICRSPMAEGVLRKLAAESGVDIPLSFDSAGTHGYHVGSPPVERAQAAALRRGVDISGLRGRQVSAEDLRCFDYILAMDEDNLEVLVELAGEDYAGNLSLFMDFAPGRAGQNVPDPYYGAPGGFERVLDLIEEAAAGFLEALQRARERENADPPVTSP